VVAVFADEENPDNDSALVHVSGLATTSETLTDPYFNVSATAIKLRRRVEMFQWVEDAEETTKKKMGGDTETKVTCHYSKGWKPNTIESSEFANPKDPGNPGTRVYAPARQTANNVTLGAFRLPAGYPWAKSPERSLYRQQTKC
jgi:hypothetical protein